MSKLFKRTIKNETKLFTDGHRSCPAAFRTIVGQHIIVNHSRFKNIEASKKKNIENLIDLMKYEIKKRRGVFLYQHTKPSTKFSFCCTYLQNKRIKRDLKVWISLK